ncbi:hypothetical protein C0J52_24598 [Blattella germanica]|nr:hypothetical protein C0J52_24598 [Blattella germanica]
MQDCTPHPNNRVIYYILLAFVSKHVPILKLSSIPIKFKVISSSAVQRKVLLVQQATDVLMPFPPPLDCQYILRFKHAWFLPSPSSFMRPLPDCILCSQGVIFGCRLSLSSVRAISVKCFEVHVFIYSNQMVSSIFIYIICIYLCLNCALCSPPKCDFYEPPLVFRLHNHASMCAYTVTCRRRRYLE